MDKFNKDVCEICGQAVVDISKLPAEIRDKIYVPEEGETYNIEENFPKGF